MKNENDESVYKTPTIKIYFEGIPSSGYVWVLYNKDGIPRAQSCKKYSSRDKAVDSVLQMCLDISHESIELGG